jgi:anti-sigma B factor antagonist
MAPGSTWNMIEDKEEGRITISGEIDYTVTPELRVRFKDFIEATRGDLSLDLSTLQYLDSSGLAVLIEARRLLDSKGRGIAILSLTPQVKKILQLTQVSSLFGI